MIIYGLYDELEPGVIRYVGKTCNPDPRGRLDGHLHEVEQGLTTYKCNWIRSVLEAGRSVVCTVIAFAPTDEELNQLERYYIKLFRDLGMKLTNATAGGEGQSKGYVRSEEAKRKRNAKLRGRRLSLEHIAKMVAGHRGRKHSAETCARISAGCKGKTKGKPKSAEHRARISAGLRGKPKPWLAERNRSPEMRRAVSALRRSEKKPDAFTVTDMPLPKGVM
jgi:hypothetical protein